MRPDFYSELEAFLALSTLAGDEKANNAAIDVLQQQLEALGFIVSVEGHSAHDQPVIVARHVSKGQDTLVLYNHYDVEPIKPDEHWNSSPFELTEREGRLFARGIADNKAVLLARLCVMKQRLAAGKALPDILWLIQGEEEVGGKLAFEVFPKQLDGINASVFVEETGYHRDGVPLLFHQYDDSVTTSAAQALASSLNEALFDGGAVIENRTLSKFGQCPFVSSIPAGSHYVGFGPNDYQARIHRDNESVDTELLTGYFDTFWRFLDWYELHSKQDVA